MVKFNDEGSGVDQVYPSGVLGYVDLSSDSVPLPDDAGESKVFAIVRCGTAALDWDYLKRNFFHEFSLSPNNEEYLTAVPVEAIVRPMVVYSDIGGDSNKFICSLPKREWCRHFGDKVNNH